MSVARVIRRCTLRGVQRSSRLSELRALVALADSGSFTGAGRLIDRDPTVLSRRVQALEARLGVRLADRTTRALTLTEAGVIYLARARGILRDLDAADREASSFSDAEPRGQLRVALPGSFGRRWLAPLLAGFLRAHPRVTLDACYSDGFVDLVGQGFDAAVRLAELPDSGLIARKIATRRRLVCASPTYLARCPAITKPEDLAGHECLCFTGRKDPFRWAFRAPSGDELLVAVTPRIASDDADLLVEAAVAGLGLFHTSDWQVGPLLASGDLVQVLPEVAAARQGGIFIVTPSSVLPGKTRAFSDWLADGLASTPWTLPLSHAEET